MPAKIYLSHLSVTFKGALSKDSFLDPSFFDHLIWRPLCVCHYICTYRYKPQHKTSLRLFTTETRLVSLSLYLSIYVSVCELTLFLYIKRETYLYLCVANRRMEVDSNSLCRRKRGPCRHTAAQTQGLEA